VYDSSKEVSVYDILRMIGKISTNIDGFTISGGEPFYKPRALRILLETLYEINDDILVFTGYTLEELECLKNEDIDLALDKCAVLIDGSYIEELNDGKGLRGSSNQKCHVFRHQEKYDNIECVERRLQTIVYNSNILTIGIPQGD
jgi:anaerobic ribonucleoside-triphosphate reductase activating protein